MVSLLPRRRRRVWTVHQNFGRARKYRRWLRSAWHHVRENKRLFRCRTVRRTWLSGTGLLWGWYSECLRRYIQLIIYICVNTLHITIENILGHLNEEEEVLQWLITQKTEDRIELITRQMLETMVEETQYLAVYFCKSKCCTYTKKQAAVKFRSNHFYIKNLRFLHIGHEISTAVMKMLWPESIK